MRIASRARLKHMGKDKYARLCIMTKNALGRRFFTKSFCGENAVFHQHREAGTDQFEAFGQRGRRSKMGLAVRYESGERSQTRPS